MDFFTIIPDAQAIVHASGVYRQVPLYQRGDKVYAKYGAGYVRLSQGGATSAPQVRWAEIDPGDGTYDESRGLVIYIPPAGGVIDGKAAQKAVAAK